MEQPSTAWREQALVWVMPCMAGLGAGAGTVQCVSGVLIMQGRDTASVGYGVPRGNALGGVFTVDERGMSLDLPAPGVIVRV